jgi:DNA-binding IclR family transcriptional regulator
MPKTKPEDEDKTQRAVQSIEVGGRLLLALAAHPGPMTLKDLAAGADLPPSRAHPYLVSFQKLGLVAQDGDTGQYRLGSAALQVGLAALHQLDAVRCATPVAEALAHETGHAVALAVWGNFGPTVIRMIDASEPLHVAMRTGTVMSILGTATGRAFAAYMSREKLERTTLAPLGDAAAARRPAAAIKARELQDVAAEIRRHGVTRAVGQPIPGVNAFSAPAFDHEGVPALVITALGHEDRFASTWDSPVAHQVREAAAEVSRQLGWIGSPPAPKTTDDRA